MTEENRLKTLRLYNLLDTAAEDAFDQLTNLAANICGTPMSLVSLIDVDRQWFKSRVGVKLEETPRNVAFCDETIKQPKPMIIPDALDDDRFKSNPLVLEDPNIRFYAGVPITVSNGETLGTLCVLDTRPRELTDSQQNSLLAIGRSVQTLVELRRKAELLAKLEDLIPLCAWCDSIRDNDSNWMPIEEYLQKHGSVTHGICPRCLDQQKPKTDKER